MTTISVIVPVYNDRDGLTATVHSLLEQEYPEDRYEILLVDNRSTDGTHDAAQALAAEYPTRVRALAETQVQSSYAARNLGVKSSRGDVLCFIDADMVAPTHYLATVAQHFADPGCQYLGCAVSVESEADTLAAHFDRVNGFPVAAYLSGLHFVPTCCLSVRADLLATVGPFDAELESGGDLEFGRRVHERGVSQHFASDTVLVHPARHRVRALARKRQRTARGHARLIRRYPGRFEELRCPYRWRRTLVPQRPARLRERGMERGIAIPVLRSIALAGLQLCLAMIGSYEFHRHLRCDRGCDRDGGADSRNLPKTVS